MHNTRMAWEWVAPASTAVVGVLSIVGTSTIAIYTSRKSRQAQADDLLRRNDLEVAAALRRERQRLYGEFLAAEQELSASALRQDDFPVILQRRIAAYSLAYQVQVLGSERVRELVRVLSDSFTQQSQKEARKLESLRAELVVAMRADLQS